MTPFAHPFFHSSRVMEPSPAQAGGVDISRLYQQGNKLAASKPQVRCPLVWRTIRVHLVEEGLDAGGLLALLNEVLGHLSEVDGARFVTVDDVEDGLGDRVPECGITQVSGQSKAQLAWRAAASPLIGRELEHYWNTACVDYVRVWAQRGWELPIA